MTTLLLYVMKVACYAAVAILSFRWFIWFTSRKRQHINRIPGLKKDRPIVGTLLALKREPTEFYYQMIGLCREFRDKKILKLRFGTVANILLFTPDQVEKLVRGNEFLDKSLDYELLHNWLGTGLLTSTGEKWKSRRRMLTPSFHFNILKDALINMNRHAQNLRDKVAVEILGKKELCNIFPYITLTSLDIICNTAMGIEMDALNNGDSEYVKAVFFTKVAIARRQRSPWYWPDIIFNNVPLGRAVKQATDLMHDYAYKVIKERRELHSHAGYSADKRKVFLDMLIECRDENGNPLSDEDIREEVDTFMFEGHDTVSSALGFCVFILASHPDHQRKCQQELDSVVGSQRNLTSEDLSKLNYIEWCIKEALRIFPPVPFFARKSPGNIQLAGYTIPKDVGVTAVVSALHRDPEIYPDAEKFDPLRFSPENSVDRHPYAYIPFSAGPRNCIGQRFAMMELKVVLSTLLLSFNFETTQTREELKPVAGLVLEPTGGIWVKASERQ